MAGLTPPVADADALYRVLGLLARLGVFSEVEPRGAMAAAASVRHGVLRDYRRES